MFTTTSKINYSVGHYGKLDELRKRMGSWSLC